MLTAAAGGIAAGQPAPWPAGGRVCRRRPDASRRPLTCPGARRPLPARAAADPPPTEPDRRADWWLRNDALVRAAPLWLGVGSGVSLIANRLLSGVAPVADAASAQSRADVLALGLTATLLLTGLQWKSLQARTPLTVPLDGDEVLYVHPALPPAAAAELTWAWTALRAATRCGSLVVVARGARLLHAGAAPRGTPPPGPAPPDVGPLWREVVSSGTGNYFANLGLFPGRTEFFSYLPANAQGVLLTPLGEQDGALALATGTQRGFSALDQAWVALIAAKLDATLGDWRPL